MGAEEYGFATAPLVVSGCIMMRVCHLNTCPVGVATQDPELRKNFTGKAEHVVNFFQFIAQEVREYMAALGFRTMDEMVGRVDRLNFRKAVDHWKAKGLDFSTILHSRDVAARCAAPQDRRAGSRARRRARQRADRPVPDDALERLDGRLGRSLRAADSQRQPHRRHDARLRGDASASAPTACRTTRSACKFTGSAGQSFGAFVPRGITLTLEGDSNDYVGKGPVGRQGRSSFRRRRPASSPRRTSSSATSRSTARRAAKRISAASPASALPCATAARSAVVEGVGDHGCEYMTGGRVVVLGRTGRNFAAGMSGGIAYVLDRGRQLPAPLQSRDGRPRSRSSARRHRAACSA